jgi:hypothetical protein
MVYKIMPKLSVGRRVHYVHQGKCKIADVSYVFQNGLANLVLTLDGLNDRALGGSMDKLHVWQTSVRQDEEKTDGSWHWPEREGD